MISIIWWCHNLRIIAKLPALLSQTKPLYNYNVFPLNLYCSIKILEHSKRYPILEAGPAEGKGEHAGPGRGAVPSWPAAPAAQP